MISQFNNLLSPANLLEYYDGELGPGFKRSLNIESHEPQNSSRCSVTNSMPAGAYHLLAVAVDILMALSLRYIDKYETILRLECRHSLSLGRSYLDYYY